jgi:cytochrome c biogenesis protein CcmG, thiol:disulfide interchange protein DsbE
MSGHEPAQPPPATQGWAGRAARLRRLSPTTKITYAIAALVLAFVAVVSLTGSGPSAARQPLPAAKGFALPQLGHPGQQVSLAAYAGQPVVVNFFASWCVPCKHETPLLARFYRASRGRVIIVGIDANDETGPALRFLTAAGVRYPVGIDPFPASATTSYGVQALPQTFFLNARHRIVRRIFGALTARELDAGVTLMDRRSSAATMPAAEAASHLDRG